MDMCALQIKYYYYYKMLRCVDVYIFGSGQRWNDGLCCCRFKRSYLKPTRYQIQELELAASEKGPDGSPRKRGVR
jgi:hypothetical protein